MTLDKIKEIVVESIRQFLVSLGREVQEVNENMKPIGDLGLDSQDGIDLVCDLEEVGFRIPNDVNPFVVEKGPCTRTVAEIAKLLQSYYVGNLEENNDE